MYGTNKTEGTKYVTNQTQTIDDGVILNYALTLEFLEAQFYQEALTCFCEADFEAAGFVGVRSEIVQIANHEQAHAEFLSCTRSFKTEF